MRVGGPGEAPAPPSGPILPFRVAPPEFPDPLPVGQDVAAAASLPSPIAPDFPSPVPVPDDIRFGPPPEVPSRDPEFTVEPVPAGWLDPGAGRLDLPPCDDVGGIPPDETHLGCLLREVAADAPLPPLPALPKSPVPLPAPPSVPSATLADLPPSAYLVRTSYRGQVRYAVGVIGVATPVNADGSATTGIAGIDLEVSVAPDPDVALNVLPRPGLAAQLARARVDIDALQPPTGGPLRELEVTVHVPLGGPPLDLPTPTQVEGSQSFAYLGYRLEPQAGDAIPARFRVVIGFPPIDLDALPGGSTEQGDAVTYTLDVLTQEPATKELVLLGGVYEGQPGGGAFVATPVSTPPAVGGTVGAVAVFQPGDSLAAEASLAPFPTKARLAIMARDGQDGTSDLALNWSANAAVRAAAAVVQRTGQGEALRVNATRLFAAPLPQAVGIVIASGPEELGVTYLASSIVTAAELQMEELATSSAGAQTSALGIVEPPAGPTGAALQVLGAEDAPALVLQRITRLSVQDLPERVVAHVDTGATPAVDIEALRPIGDAVFTTSNAPYQPPGGQHAIILDIPALQVTSAGVRGLREFHYASDGSEVMVSYEKVPGGDFTMAYVKGGISASGWVSNLPGSLDFATDLASYVTYEASEVVRQLRLDATLAAQGLAVALGMDDIPRSIEASYDGAAGALDLGVSEPLGGFDLLLRKPSGLDSSAVPFTAARVRLADVPDLAVRWSSDGKQVDARVLDLQAAIGLVEVALASDAFRSLVGSHALYYETTTERTAGLRLLGLRAVSVDTRSGAVLDFQAREPQPFQALVVEGGATSVVRVEALPTQIRITTDLEDSFDYSASQSIARVSLQRDEPATGARTSIAVQGLPDRVRVVLDMGAGRLDFWASQPIGSIAASVVEPAGIGGSAFTAAVVDIQGLPSFGANWSEDLSSLAFSTENPADAVGSVAVAMGNGGIPGMPGSHVALVDVPGREGVSVRLDQLHRVAYERAADGRAAIDFAARQPQAFTLRVEDADATTLLRIADLPAEVKLSTNLEDSLDYAASSSVSQLDLTFREKAAGGASAVVGIAGLPDRVRVDLDLDAGRLDFWASEPITSLGARVVEPAGFEGTAYTVAAASIEQLPSFGASWTPDFSEMAFAVENPADAVGRLAVALGNGGLVSLPGSHVLVTGVSGSEAASVRVEGLQGFGLERSKKQTTLDFAALAVQDFTLRHEDDDTLSVVRVKGLPPTIRLVSNLKDQVTYTASGAMPMLNVTHTDKTSGGQVVLGISELPNHARVDLDVDGGALDFFASRAIGSLEARVVEPGGITGTDFTSATVTIAELPSFGATWDSDFQAFAFNTANPEDAVGSLALRLAAGPPVGLPGDHVLVDTREGKEAVSVALTGLRSASFDRSSGIQASLSTAGGQGFIVQIEDTSSSSTIRLSELPSEMLVSTDVESEFTYEASDAVQSLLMDRIHVGGLEVVLRITGLPERVDASYDMAAGIVRFTPSASIGHVVLEAEDSAGIKSTTFTKALAVLENVPAVQVTWDEDGPSAEVQADEPLDSVRIALADGELTDYAAVYPGDYVVATDGRTFLPIADAKDEISLLATGVQSLSFRRTDAGLEGGFEKSRTRPFDAYVLGSLEIISTRIRDLPASLSFSTDLEGRLHYEASTAIDEMKVNARLYDFLGSTLQEVLTAEALAQGIPERIDMVFDPATRVVSFNASAEVGLVKLKLWDDRASSDFENVEVRVEDMPRAFSASWTEDRSAVVFNTDDSSSGIGLVKVGIAEGDIVRLGTDVGHQVYFYEPKGSEWSIFARIEGLLSASFSRVQDVVTAQLGLGSIPLPLRVRVESEGKREALGYLNARLEWTPQAMSFASDLKSFFRYQGDEVELCFFSCAVVQPDLDVRACIGANEWDIAAQTCKVGGDEAVFSIAGLPTELDFQYQTAGSAVLKTNEPAEKMLVKITTADPQGLFDTIPLEELFLRLGESETATAPTSLEATWADPAHILLDAEVAFPVEVRVVAVGSATTKPTSTNHVKLAMDTDTSGNSDFEAFYLRLNSIEDAEFCRSCSPMVYKASGLPAGEELSVNLDEKLRGTISGLPASFQLKADLDGGDAWNLWWRKLSWSASHATTGVELHAQLGQGNDEWTGIDTTIERMPREVELKWGSEPRVCTNENNLATFFRIDTSGRLWVKDARIKFLEDNYWHSMVNVLNAIIPDGDQDGDGVAEAQLAARFQFCNEDRIRVTGGCRQTGCFNEAKFEEDIVVAAVHYETDHRGDGARALELFTVVEAYVCILWGDILVYDLDATLPSFTWWDPTWGIIQLYVLVSETGADYGTKVCQDLAKKATLDDPYPA